MYYTPKEKEMKLLKEMEMWYNSQNREDTEILLNEKKQYSNPKYVKQENKQED